MTQMSAPTLSLGMSARVSSRRAAEQRRCPQARPQASSAAGLSVGACAQRSIHARLRLGHFKGTRVPERHSRAGVLVLARASGGAAGAAPLPDAESLKATLAAVMRDPWDTPPRPWRTFWATRLAATVVSADDAAGQVNVTPVEMSGLKPPADADDALHRLKTNAVLYRQNYALVFLGALCFGALRYRSGPFHLAAIVSLVAFALSSSDRLLGEVQLASDGRFVWNAKRVAGVDRALLLRFAPVVGFLAVAACPLASFTWVLATAVFAAVLCVGHAILRPVDLESTFAQIWGDLSSAKNRDDVASAIKSAGSGISRWWTSFKSEPAEAPPPVIIVRKGAPGAGGDAGGGGGGGGGAGMGGARRPPPPSPPKQPPSKQLPPGMR